MNNFHIFRKFRQISKTLSPIYFKYQQISRLTFLEFVAEFRQSFIKISHEKCKIRRKQSEKIQFIFSFANVDEFDWNLEVWAMQKYANLVDLVKSFPTSIYLQKSASIQPRTSLSKFEVIYSLLFIRLLHALRGGDPSRRGAQRLGVLQEGGRTLGGTDVGAAWRTRASAFLVADS